MGRESRRGGSPPGAPRRKQLTSRLVVGPRSPAGARARPGWPAAPRGPDPPRGHGGRATSGVPRNTPMTQAAGHREETGVGRHRQDEQHASRESSPRTALPAGGPRRALPWPGSRRTAIPRASDRAASDADPERDRHVRPQPTELPDVPRVGRVLHDPCHQEEGPLYMACENICRASWLRQAKAVEHGDQPQGGHRRPRQDPLEIRVQEAPARRPGETWPDRWVPGCPPRRATAPKTGSSRPAGRSPP